MSYCPPLVVFVIPNVVLLSMNPSFYLDRILVLLFATYGSPSFANPYSSGIPLLGLGLAYFLPTWNCWPFYGSF